MSDKRPVLFIHPLNESLTKLKEVLEESAEQDGLAIHEVKNIQELSQLLIQVGPSLALYGHPKACAMGLQNNKKIIKRLQSKTVMLISQQIPRKTLDKFMKIGLTDCIVEPIVPKTLLYKIKLLIRSLPTLSNEEDDYKKFSTDSQEQTEEEMSLKKGQKKEASPEDSEQKTKSDKDANVIEDQLRGKKSGNSEDVIDGQMRGKNSNGENIETNYEGDVNNEEAQDDSPLVGEIDVGADIVEKYYKGEQSGEFDQIEQEDLVGEGAVDHLDDKEISELRNNVLLEVENDPEDSVQPNTDPLSELLKKKKKTELNLEDDETSKESKPKGKKEEAVATKPKTKLSVDDDEEEKEIATSQKAKAQAKKDKHQALDVEDDSPLELKKKFKENDQRITHDSTGNELEIEDDSLEDEKDHGKVEHIEKYYKNKEKNEELELEDDESEILTRKVDKNTGSAATPLQKKKTKLNVEQEGIDYQKESRDKKLAAKKEKESTQLEVDDDAEFKQVDKTQDSPAARKLKQTQKLEVEAEEKELKKKEKAEHVPAAQMLKKASKLEIEEEESAELKLRKRNKQADKKEKQEGLDIYDDSRAKKNKAGADSHEDLKGHSKNSGLKVDAEDDSDAGPMGKVDQIQKFYGYKSKQLDDANGDKTKSRKREALDHTKKKDDYKNELIISHEDLGEQTIDYKQIKEQFAALEGEYTEKAKLLYEINDESSIGKKNAPSFSQEGENAASSVNGMSGGHEAVQLNSSFSQHPGLLENLSQDNEGEEAVVIHPDSKGLEFVVRVMNMYLGQKNPEQILEAITTKIFKAHHGVTTFFYENLADGKMMEFFSGHALLPNGLPLDDKGQPLDWSKYVLANQSQWKQHRLPHWSDETFQAKPLRFINPYFAGNTFLGLALCDFPTGLSPELAARIEIMLESARAIYLENLRQVGQNADSQTKNSTTTKEEKKGLLSRFFGKKESA